MFQLNAELFHKIKRVSKAIIHEAGLESNDSINTVKQDFSCPIPSHYYIETGNICMLKCPFCITGNGTSTMSKGMMSLDHYNIILDKIVPYAELIEFCNWGEPFLNKNILEMISLAYRKGITTVIHSNLNMKNFDEKECIQIIQSGLSLLSGSIDGASQDTYNLYRRGGSFERAIDNLVKLKQAKEKVGAKTPHLVWQFLIHKFNEHEIEKARQISLHLGIHIQFGIMGGVDPAWESSYHNDTMKLRQLQKKMLLTIIRSILHKVNIIINKKNVEKLPLAISKVNLLKKLGSWCEQPFNTMIINWDGNVLPCCGAYKDEMFLGNLLNKDIDNLWNNNEFKRCRDYLFYYNHKKETGSICELCDLT